MPPVPGRHRRQIGPKAPAFAAGLVLGRLVQGAVGRVLLAGIFPVPLGKARFHHRKVRVSTLNDDLADLAAVAVQLAPIDRHLSAADEA